MSQQSSYDIDDTYSNPMKQCAFEAYVTAVDNIKKGELDLTPVHIRTAQTQFEQFWSRNYE